MSGPIDLKHLRELLANAPRYPEAAPRSDGIYTCPMCDGEASVEAVSATGVLMVGGIQCFGIGTDHQNLEALARAAVKALPALLDRLERAEEEVRQARVDLGQESLLTWALKESQKIDRDRLECAVCDLENEKVRSAALESALRHLYATMRAECERLIDEAQGALAKKMVAKSIVGDAGVKP